MQDEGDERRADRLAPSVHVDTLEVRQAPMPQSLALTGSLRGKRQTDLAANAAGRVVETFVERGSEVKQWRPLGQARRPRGRAHRGRGSPPTSPWRALQQDTAKRECDRYKALLDKHAITQSEFDHAADQWP